MLSKNFPITEQVKVQFRTEFFDVFNTPQFDLSNATIFSGAAVGTITGIVGIPRQIPFGLKLVLKLLTVRERQKRSLARLPPPLK